MVNYINNKILSEDMTQELSQDMKLFDNPKVRESYERMRETVKKAGLLGRTDMFDY